MLPPSAGWGAAMAQGGSRGPRWKSASSSPTTTLRSRYWPASTISAGLPEDEELEILPFREREQRRVIGRLALLLEQLEVAEGLSRGLADGAEELLRGDARGA